MIFATCLCCGRVSSKRLKNRRNMATTYVWLRFIALQATLAATLSKAWSHTVPHCPLWNTSNRPSLCTIDDELLFDTSLRDTADKHRYSYTYMLPGHVSSTYQYIK